MKKSEYFEKYGDFIFISEKQRKRERRIQTLKLIGSYTLWVIGGFLGAGVFYLMILWAAACQPLFY